MSKYNITTKICCGDYCGHASKPLSDFAKGGYTADGHKRHCKDCVTAYRRDHWEQTLVRTARTKDAKDIRLWKIAPSLLPMITPDRISDMLLMQRGKCIYRHCGADMTYGPAVDRRMGDAVSLERIDNNIGHVRENCVLACVRCNKRRADRLSFDEFDALPSQ